MSNEQTPWLTVDQVSDLFGVSRETIRRWIRSGDIPVLDLGGRKAGYRIRRTDLEQFIEERYGPLGKEIAAPGEPRTAIGKLL